MNVRLETRYAGLIIPMRASRIRYVNSTRHYVYYFSVGVEQIDDLLRDYYRYVDTYRYYAEIRQSQEHHVFGNLSLRISNRTLQLTLSHTSIYGYRHYHLYYAPFVRAIGFYPQDDTSWMIVEQDRQPSSDTTIRPILRYIAEKYR